MTENYPTCVHLLFLCCSRSVVDSFARNTFRAPCVVRHVARNMFFQLTLSGRLRCSAHFGSPGFCFVVTPIRLLYALCMSLSPCPSPLLSSLLVSPVPLGSVALAAAVSALGLTGFSSLGLSFQGGSPVETTGLSPASQNPERGTSTQASSPYAFHRWGRPSPKPA